MKNFFLFSSFLLLLSCAQTPKPSTESSELETSLKHYHYALPPVKITGQELPMFGKWSQVMVNLPGTQDSKKIWIKKVKVTLIDEETGKENENLFCHAHVGEDGINSYKTNRFFGSHAGTNVTDLPKGFAVPMVVSEKRPLVFFAMAADYTHSGKPKTVHVEFDIDYYDDETAQRLGIKDLDFQFVYGRFEGKGNLDQIKKTEHQNMHAHHPVKEIKIIEHKGHKFIKDEEMGHLRDNHIHWFVPIGRHEYRSNINNQIHGLRRGNVRVHHIHLHLHPYAEYGEIYDATEKKTVWRGYAKTYPDRPVLEGVERYSNTEGFVMRNDHQYEAVSVYNNTTGKDISAMQTMRILYRPEK